MKGSSVDREALRREVAEVVYAMLHASEQRARAITMERGLQAKIKTLGDRLHELLLRYHGCHNCAVSGIVECECEGKENERE